MLEVSLTKTKDINGGENSRNFQVHLIQDKGEGRGVENNFLGIFSCNSNTIIDNFCVKEIAILIFNAIINRFVVKRFVRFKFTEFIDTAILFERLNLYV